MERFFDIHRLKDGRTRLITAENVYGEPGCGGKAPLSMEPQPEVAHLGQEWGGINSAARDLGQKWKVRPCISLKAGSVTPIMDINGPCTVTHIWSTVEPRFYRDIILRMFWDDEVVPSVESPLGDFYCCGWKMPEKIVSLPINVNPSGGLNCFFPMPFRKHGRITVENRAPETISGFFYAISCEDAPIAEDAAYFHASFRRSNPLEYMEDHVVADGIRGRGHYVGTHIGWQQNSEGWWGEGEIKAFIDGDGEFPSYCGTGTEDYFGGAWCFGENFSAPFSATGITQSPQAD